MQPQKMSMSQRQFRIGDLAKELKVKNFVIRFWEKEFGLKSDRSQGGQRFYSEQDLRTFLLIKDLLYQQGFTIAGAKKQLPVLLKDGATVGAEAPAAVEAVSASFEAACEDEGVCTESARPEPACPAEATLGRRQIEGCERSCADSDEDDEAAMVEPVQTVQPEATFALMPIEAEPVVQAQTGLMGAAPAVEPEPERMMAATAVDLSHHSSTRATADETATIMGATNASPVNEVAEEVALETEEDLEAAAAFGGEVDDDMVHPATKESCPCAHVHDQLSGLKTQLLELKALLER
jgi:DNA-binding transcriptional MerR regulator